MLKFNKNNEKTSILNNKNFKYDIFNTLKLHFLQHGKINLKSPKKHIFTSYLKN